MTFPPTGSPLPDLFRGLPRIDREKCPAGCSDCAEACPTSAIVCAPGSVELDLGRCLFCTDCVRACPEGSIAYTTEYRMSARTRSALVLRDAEAPRAEALEGAVRRVLGRSLKLRQVSAGGCSG